MRCNLYKSDYTSATSNVNTIDRILHPQKDSIAEHFREDLQTGQLESLTQTGRFHITLLHLNLPPLIAFRLSRTRKRLTGQFLEETLQENAEQRVLIQILLRMIEYKSDEPS